MKKLIVLCAALLSVSVWAKAPAISSAQLVGSWQCHATHSLDDGFELTSDYYVHASADGKFQEEHPSLILRQKQSGEAVHYRAKSQGTWTVADDILQESIQTVLFEHIKRPKPLSEEMEVMDGMMVLMMNAQIKKKVVEQSEHRMEMPDADTLLLHELEDNIQTRCVRIKS
ncbi:MAG: hypothetical protein Q4E77_07655 [Conchiformibius sp.]|nr:hypothetical protein [Conchiformibius sp.]